MPWMSTYQIVAKRADYTRTASGWRGEFRGPFFISVEASSLESCRDSLLAAADAKVAQWLTGEWREPTPSDRTNSPTD